MSEMQKVLEQLNINYAQFKNEIENLVEITTEIYKQGVERISSRFLLEQDFVEDEFKKEFKKELNKSFNQR